MEKVSNCETFAFDIYYKKQQYFTKKGAAQKFPNNYSVNILKKKKMEKVTISIEEQMQNPSLSVIDPYSLESNVYQLGVLCRHMAISSKSLPTLEISDVPDMSGFSEAIFGFAEIMETAMHDLSHFVDNLNLLMAKITTYE